RGDRAPAEKGEGEDEQARIAGRRDEQHREQERAAEAEPQAEPAGDPSLPGSEHGGKESLGRLGVSHSSPAAPSASGRARSAHLVSPGGCPRETPHSPPP